MPRSWRLPLRLAEDGRPDGSQFAKPRDTRTLPRSIPDALEVHERYIRATTCAYTRPAGTGGPAGRHGRHGQREVARGAATRGRMPGIVTGPGPPRHRSQAARTARDAPNDRSTPLARPAGPAYSSSPPSVETIHAGRKAQVRNPTKPLRLTAPCWRACPLAWLRGPVWRGRPQDDARATAPRRPATHERPNRTRAPRAQEMARAHRTGTTPQALGSNWG